MPRTLVLGSQHGNLYRPLGGVTNNPFRSLAPAIFAGGEALDDVWIYVMSPLIGATIAVILTCTLGARVHTETLHQATGSFEPYFSESTSTKSLGTGVGRIGPENLEKGTISW